MKVMVTGGAGFIGSHIIDVLLQENYKIIVLDKVIPSKHHDDQSLITYYQIDINDHLVEAIFSKELPDVIIHLAAQISVPQSMKDPVNDIKINGYGTIKLLQYAAQYNVKKFIFASSAAVYGVPTYVPIDESHPIRPISFYGLSKAVGEQYVQLYKEIYDIDYSILRLANVYGPGQSVNSEAGVISIFIDKIKDELPLTVYGDGMQTRDFVYVKDVANACLKAIKASGSHILNVSSNSKLSLNELAQLLIEQSGSSIVTSYEPRKPGDILHSRLKNSLAKHILNWKPRYTIEAGLTEIFSNILTSSKKTEST